MESKTHAVRHAFWEKVVAECNQSGMRKIEWMNLHNINPKSYYYWQNKLRIEKADQLACIQSADKKNFTELTAPVKTSETVSSVTIHKEGISIELCDSISDEFLERIIKAVSHA